MYLYIILVQTIMNSNIFICITITVQIQWHNFIVQIGAKQSSGNFLQCTLQLNSYLEHILVVAEIYTCMRINLNNKPCNNECKNVQYSYFNQIKKKCISALFSSDKNDNGYSLGRMYSPAYRHQKLQCMHVDFFFICLQSKSSVYSYLDLI